MVAPVFCVTGPGFRRGRGTGHGCHAEDAWPVSVLGGVAWAKYADRSLSSLQIFDTSGLNVLVGPKGLKKGDELTVRAIPPSLLADTPPFPQHRHKAHTRPA